MKNLLELDEIRLNTHDSSINSLVKIKDGEYQGYYKLQTQFNSVRCCYTDDKSGFEFIDPSGGPMIYVNQPLNCSKHYRNSTSLIVDEIKCVKGVGFLIKLIEK
jgi:hypothetical protein